MSSLISIGQVHGFSKEYENLANYRVLVSSCFNRPHTRQWNFETFRMITLNTSDSSPVCTFKHCVLRQLLLHCVHIFLFQKEKVKLAIISKLAINLLITKVFCYKLAKKNNSCIVLTVKHGIFWGAKFKVGKDLKSTVQKVSNNQSNCNNLVKNYSYWV